MASKAPMNCELGRRPSWQSISAWSPPSIWLHSKTTDARLWSCWAMRDDDMFFDWVSEKAEGSWDVFREGHGWLFGKDKSSSATMALYSALGHVEMDWLARKWAVAPLTLA